MELRGHHSSTPSSLRLACTSTYRLPWPPPCVTDVNDPHLVGYDFVIDLVGVSNDGQLVDAGLVRLRCHERKVGKRGNPLVDQVFYRLCRSGSPTFQVGIDRIEVAP